MPAHKLIVGNWKMNGLQADSKERVEKLAQACKGQQKQSFDMVLCPPDTMIGTVAGCLKGSAIRWGGQDCHAQVSGAFTGDTSAQMLADLGCTHVIVGHSERRQHHKETSADVAAKAKAAHAAGLIAIICIGETDAERTAGVADKIVTEQLKVSIPECSALENTVVAYEPVWAIGTGKTASADDIRHMHAVIRAELAKKMKDGQQVFILYGGSVKASNAKEIMSLPNVNGVLVGGASLKADEFMAIAQATI